MVVQATNIGYDVDDVQFDIAIPGGGVGAFPKGCTKQYNAPANGWGSLGAYGGTASRSECDALPKKLRDGCYFRFDWMKGSNNPDVLYERVSCPAELVAKSQCRRDDDGKYPSVVQGETPPAMPKPKPTASPTPQRPTQELYGQCAGKEWTGITQCGSEARCVYQNDWYSQCLPKN